MTFQPFIPGGGIAGWRFLTSTLDTQKSAFGGSAVIERELAYFRENIGSVETAADLVSDYRLLSVALGAFDLSEEIGNKYLIRKVLEGGTQDSDALANRLEDKRYKDLSKVFGFGDFARPNTILPGFSDRIESGYVDRQFEVAVGAVDDTMRLALNARRELPELGGSGSSDTAKWFTLMGTPPLRAVMEKAYGFPSSFATISLDRQLEDFKEASERFFGTESLSTLAEEPIIERLIDRFVASSLGSSNAKFVPALTLLGQGA